MASSLPPFSARSQPDQPRFGRMFPDLPPWEPPANEPDPREYLWSLAKDLYGDGDENPHIPAGYTYFGQFVNHDVTLDSTSSLRRPTHPDQFRSRRTPRFDLDSVYGRGPREDRHLYSQQDTGRLLLGQTEFDELDLPRNRDAGKDVFSTSSVDRYRRALIGDSRNDDNIILAQLHLAFLRFHNARYREFAAADPRGAFERARQLTQWHYQWVVIHDFLARFCGRDRVNATLQDYRRPRSHVFDHPSRPPFVPVEFSFAVFRAGHSIIRPSYHLSDFLEQELGGDPIDLFGPEHPRNNLNGGRELPKDWSVQWDRFVDTKSARRARSGTPRGSAQRSAMVDTHLTPALEGLPLEGVPPRERSLAYVTLLRGWTLGLPSGQAVARRLGRGTVLKPHRAGCEDPLWLYVLREAEAQKSRTARSGAFGEVGASIATEVLIAFLVSDPDSYFRSDPEWKPTLSHRGDNFELFDFLEHAGVPMTAANWDERRRAASVIRGLAHPVIRASG